MRDFINRYTGRIDYVIYSVIGSMGIAFILLVLANKLGFNTYPYRVETFGALLLGQLIIFSPYSISV